MGDLLHFTRAPAYVRPIPKAGFSVKVIAARQREAQEWKFEKRSAEPYLKWQIATYWNTGMTYIKARKILMEMLTMTENPVAPEAASDFLDMLEVDEVFAAVTSEKACVDAVEAMIRRKRREA